MKTQPQCNSKTREPAFLADLRDLSCPGDPVGAQLWQEIARDRDSRLKDLRSRNVFASEILRSVAGRLVESDLHLAAILDSVIGILGDAQ